MGFDNAADQQGAVPHCTLLLADTAHTLVVSLYGQKVIFQFQNMKFCWFSPV